MKKGSADACKVMVIGLDGADPDLISRWMANGFLPNLSRLAGEGCWGRIKSSIPPMTASAWSSFMTGKNPGKHGIYQMVFFDRWAKKLIPVNSTHRRSRDLWELLSYYGKKVIVVGVPLTYPVRKVNGIIISGFMTPRNVNDYAYPPSILEELRKEVGGFNIVVDKHRRAAEKSLVPVPYEDVYLKDIHETLENRLKCILYLLDKYDWDFFMTVIQETDGILHLFWHHMDPYHPRHEYDRSSFYGKEVLRYYQAVDNAVGEITKRADENTIVIVMSDHGHQGFHKFVSLNNIFIKKGWLKFNHYISTHLKYTLFKAGITPINFFRLMIRLKLARFRYSLVKEHTRKKFRRFFLSLSDVDWKITKAYSYGAWGQIYINREANLDSKELGSVKKEIIDLILRIKDPSTNQRIFSPNNVYLKEDIYHGPYVNQAPDIVAIPNPPYKTFPDYEFGSNKIITDSQGWSGNHSIYGMLIIKGRVIKRGVIIDGANIVDIAPTIMYLMGVPVEEDMDGRVIMDVIKEEHSSSRPVIKASVGGEFKEGSLALTKDQEEEIKKHLRSLGYL